MRRAIFSRISRTARSSPPAADELRTDLRRSCFEYAAARARTRLPMPGGSCGPRRIAVARGLSADEAGVRPPPLLAALTSPVAGAATSCRCCHRRGRAHRPRLAAGRPSALSPGSPITKRWVNTGTTAPSSKNVASSLPPTGRGDFKGGFIGLDLRDHVSLETASPGPLHTIARRCTLLRYYRALELRRDRHLTVAFHRLPSGLRKTG